MYIKTNFFFLCLIFQANLIFSQENPDSIKVYHTNWMKGEFILDGKLEEEAWKQVEWGGDFIGHEPDYQSVPSQKTQFKILYDAKYLYIGVRAFDTAPEKIVKRMSRRDGFDGDWVEINIDSYHDKRTAFSFTASVSGVKGDEYVSNNGQNWDDTWDPIWYLKTSVDKKGWIAEYKIPLSQLRFANKEEHVWGIQLTRRLFREQERSTWQAINPTDPGWVHLFGELRGIKGIKPQKQLEIQPYIVGLSSKFPKEEENPFLETGKESNVNMGLDAKIGLTSDVTLDLTVNPDFGQVESDPSQVNLSALQLFFREQRPFFLEGNNILTFGTSNDGNNNLFYSRRIGSPPKGNASGDHISHSDVPNQARILGAAKLTGKNSKGFSWGILESVTNREMANVIDTLGQKSKVKVEPFTNYFVGRTQQDINGGNTVIGAIFTQVNRIDNRENGLELIHDKATSGGIDLNHNLWDRKYGITAKYIVGNVKGTQGAIYETQTSSERYFQRINNFHKGVDSTRMSLLGTAASLSFDKRSGNWQWAVGSNYRSPELDINDIGFLQQTDFTEVWAWSQYRFTKPTKLFRTQRYNIYHEQNFDFGKVRTARNTEINARVQFHNFWFFGNGLWIEGNRVSNTDLRGTSSITYPGAINYWYFFQTNNQKKVRLSFNNWFYWGSEHYAKGTGINVNLTIRPTDAFRLSLAPSMSIIRNDLQYIPDQETNDDRVSLLGRVKQETYRMSIRANYNITPNLTVEFWGQPFISKGIYSQYKRTMDPNAHEYNKRFMMFKEENIVLNEDDEYRIFENKSDKDPLYTFSNPDFNTVQFRSNMVMRWEYIPGSTLFLVWANNASSNDLDNENGFKNIGSDLLNLKGTNTFLIKYTYRFIL